MLKGRVAFWLIERIFDLGLESMVHGVVEELKVTADVLQVEPKIGVGQEFFELVVNGAITDLARLLVHQVLCVDGLEGVEQT